MLETMLMIATIIASLSATTGMLLMTFSPLHFPTLDYNEALSTNSRLAICGYRLFNVGLGLVLVFCVGGLICDYLQ